MPVKQQKKLSNSVKIKFFNACKIIEELKLISQDILKEDSNVIGIYLFGSIIRETYVPGSDADILIVLKDDKRRVKDRIPKFLRYFLSASIATDIFPYTEKELNDMISSNNSFITNIWREKIVLTEKR